MKKQLLLGAALLAAISGAAAAADLGRPAPEPVPAYTKAPPPVAYSWSGCYIGGNVGGIFARQSWTAVPEGFDEGSVDFNGGLAGAQAGCNWQVSQWVFGAQGDWDWTSTSATFNDLAFADTTNSVKIKSLASVTGRIGYAWDRFLLYAKGGGAWERADFTQAIGGEIFDVSNTRSGWTVGGGGEYAFTDWLTGFVEYDFYDFGTTNVPFGAAFGSDVKETTSVLKGGLNFKFGWGGPFTSGY